VTAAATADPQSTDDQVDVEDVVAEAVENAVSQAIRRSHRRPVPVRAQFALRLSVRKILIR